MIDILIVEDNIKDLEYCEKIIRTFDGEINIRRARSGEEAYSIIKDKNRNIDVAFIDIEMEAMDGFDLAYLIRKNVETHLMHIIFVSGTDNDSIEVYKKIHNYSYIQKPYEKKEFYQIIEPLFKSILESKKTPSKSRILVNTEEGRFLVPIEDILYVETIKRVPHIVTTNKRYPAKGKTLLDILEQINDRSFVRCHRSCCVNLDKVDSIKLSIGKTNDLYFEENKSIRCPLSNHYKKDILERLNRVK